MIAGIIRFLTGAQARWIDTLPLPADGLIPQRIYFANHTSNLDAPVIWAALPPGLRARTRPVAAADYWTRGPIRRFFANRVFRCVLIPRHGITAHHHPLAAIEPALADGCSLILFPEGTRAVEDDAELGTFKPGLWHLVRKHPQIELIPVYLENLNRILPKGEFILIPLLAVVSFGPALRIDEGEAKEGFLLRARAALEKLASR